MNKKVVTSLIGLTVVMGIAAVFSLSGNTNDFPDDFIQVQRDINKGITYDLCSIGTEYYMHPEFYPSYPSGYFQYLQNQHDYTRWIIHGYGAYPGEMSYSVKSMKANQTITICTFIHTSFAAETFQGIKLISNNSDMFDVKFEPNEFLLYPAFPSTKRNNNWTYRVVMTFIANENISFGNYDFQVIVVPPEDSIKFREETKKYSLDTYKCPWIGKCDSNTIELRKRVYIDGGQFEASNFFKFNLKVG